MSNTRFNNHQNIPLSAITIFGDTLICMALYSLFCYFCGHVSSDDFTRNLVFVSTNYFFCVLHRGVILYKRNVRDYQILLLVFGNLMTFTMLSMVLLTVADIYIMPLRYSAAFVMSLFLMSTLYRLSIKGMVKVYRSQNRHMHHVVFVGSKVNIQELYEEMVGVPYFGYHVDGYFDYQPNPGVPSECPYLGKPSDVVDFLRGHGGIHELYCSLASRHKDDIMPIIHYCMNNIVHFNSVPNVSNYLHHRMYLNTLGSVPYLSLICDPLEKVEKRMVKRLFDIAFSLLFLCTLFPVIFVVVAIITKCTMPGPVFFRQKRNGLNGKEFYCIKFRSMRVNADADRLQATKDDPRKTRWGNIMRKTNIDELPQFINVLMGDMSVVGPRPHMVKHTEEYSKLIDKYMVRHFVKPGITGWSQVTGFRGETKELSQMAGRIKGDIWYIEHWSLWLDIYIIYKTVANVIRGEKEAY